jgi:hypothetical protein
MLTNMKNSNRIKNRLIQCVEDGELSLGDIIDIIQYLANKAFVEIIGNRFIID